MTKEQKADVLLEAERRWQNGHGDVIAAMARFGIDLCDYYDPGDSYEPASRGIRDQSTSACLSEVAALGFDVETVE